MSDMQRARGTRYQAPGTGYLVPGALGEALLSPDSFLL